MRYSTILLIVIYSLGSTDNLHYHHGQTDMLMDAELQEKKIGLAMRGRSFV